MKPKTPLLLFFTLPLFLLSCKKFFNNCDAEPGSTNVIGLNEKICSSSGDYSVTFTNVLYDERCFGSGCSNFDGVAKLRFVFNSKRQSIPFHLYTSNTNGYYADTTINGFHFILGIVTPQPRVGQTYDEKDYKIELTVRK